MRRVFGILVASVLCLGVGVSARPKTPRWGLTIAGTESAFSDDGILAGQPTSDGGFVVAGFVETDVFEDALVVKLDKDGNVEWQRQYGGERWERALSIQQTTDGGYIVGGYTHTFGTPLRESAWVFKLDESGDIRWQKVFLADTVQSVRETPDGGFIAVGFNRHHSMGDGDGWAVKLKPNGNVDWRRNFGGSEFDVFFAVEPTRQGTFVIAGSSRSFGLGIHGWVIELDADGSVLWDKSYGATGSNPDELFDIEQTKDGGYVVAGVVNRPRIEDGRFEDKFDAWVLKLDRRGNVDWQRTYGGDFHDHAFSVEEIGSKGFVVAGRTRGDAWVFRLNRRGRIKAQWTYGDTGDVQRQAPPSGVMVREPFRIEDPTRQRISGVQSAYAIARTSRGDYLLAGITSGSGPERDDALVLRISSRLRGCSAIAAKSRWKAARTRETAREAGARTLRPNADTEDSGAEVRDSETLVTTICKPRQSASLTASAWRLGRRRLPTLVGVLARLASPETATTAACSS